MPSPRQASTPSQQPLYDDPVIYDILHAPGTIAEVRGLASIERRYTQPPPSKTTIAPKSVASPRLVKRSSSKPAGTDAASVWLEPACGTGRYLIAAAKLDADHRANPAPLRRCIGFDLKDGMVRYAQAQAQAANVQDRVRFFQGDMTRFASHIEPSSVTLAFNPINTIRHLGADAQMLAHFEEIASVLASTGVYVVGLSLSAPEVEGPSEDVWEGRRPGLRVKQIAQYEPPAPPPSRDRREWVHSHLVITRLAPSRTIEHRDDRYALRTYTRPQWDKLIKRSPLQPIASVDESGKPHDPGLLGYALWVLKKR